MRMLNALPSAVQRRCRKPLKTRVPAPPCTAGPERHKPARQHLHVRPGVPAGTHRASCGRLHVLATLTGDVVSRRLTCVAGPGLQILHIRQRHQARAPQDGARHARRWSCAMLSILTQCLPLCATTHGWAATHAHDALLARCACPYSSEVPRCASTLPAGAQLNGKQGPYEEDVRVPLAVRLPGALQGIQLPHLVSNIDFVSPPPTATGSAPAARMARPRLCSGQACTPAAVLLRGLRTSL